MSVDTIDDVINTLQKLKDCESLVDFVEEFEEGDGSSMVVINYIEDDDLRDNVDEIELSASHFFLNDDGKINKYACDKLKKNGFTVEKLTDKQQPYTHSIGCDKFMIYFSNY